MAVKKIEIKHLTRIEGHGGITVEIDGRRVSRVKLEILEGTRFYEALLRGKHYLSLATIISRVCAICSAAHTICAQMAVEDAFKIKVSKRTMLLRDLLLQGENLESHALHIFFLVLPDYLGYDSALEMAKEHQEAVKTGLYLKKLGNRIQEVIGGRAVHPVNVMVGRFGKVPDKRRLEELLAKVEEGLSMISWLIDFFINITLPEISSGNTIYMSLNSEGEYGFLSRKVAASDGHLYEAEEFSRICSERIVSHSHAKQALYSGRPFMVGAQSRIALNNEKLSGKALDIYQALSKSHGSFASGNPLFNNLAQAVEIVFSLEKAREHIQNLLEESIAQDPAPEIIPRKSTGTGILEAPRGILFHRYRFDSQGKIQNAEVITPTAQNLANIEKDLKSAAEKAENLIGPNGLLPAGMGPFSERDLAYLLQIVVRAYDPCISCSVH